MIQKILLAISDLWYDIGGVLFDIGAKGGETPGG